MSIKRPFSNLNIRGGSFLILQSQSNPFLSINNLKKRDFHSTAKNKSDIFDFIKDIICCISSDDIEDPSSTNLNAPQNPVSSEDTTHPNERTPLLDNNSSSTHGAPQPTPPLGTSEGRVHSTVVPSSTQTDSPATQQSQTLPLKEGRMESSDNFNTSSGSAENQGAGSSNASAKSKAIDIKPLSADQLEARYKPGQPQTLAKPSTVQEGSLRSNILESGKANRYIEQDEAELSAVEEEEEYIENPQSSEEGEDHVQNSSSNKTSEAGEASDAGEASGAGEASEASEAGEARSD